MKKQYIALFALTLGLSLGVQAQENVTINTGLFSTRNGTEVSTYFDFINTNSGDVINDGSFYFYGNYSNDGLFSYSTNSTTGYVVFEGKNNTIQNISGNSPSFFYDILFNKSGNDRSFHLTNPIESKGKVNLHDGVVFMDKDLGGSFVFLKGSSHINTSNQSYVDGEVTKEGNEAFKYPIGDSGYYRFASISAPSNVASQYTGEYFLKNSNNNYPHRNKTGVLNLINDKEYWVVDKSNATPGSVILTLSWDENTTPAALLANGAENLHIVRWDDSQSLWVDQGGVVDYANKTVTTPIDVDGFGVFTLSSVKADLINCGDVVIYNGVTPDGDGKNDYFIIDNIQNFPNNTVRIFDRWGVEVFRTTNYDSTGNVFKGYSEGRATIDKSKKLPSGTYYYILEYECNQGGSSQMIRKAAFLHLESND